MRSPARLGIPSPHPVSLLPWGITVVVAIDNGSENTWADGAWSREEIRCCYGGCCAAAEILCRA